MAAAIAYGLKLCTVGYYPGQTSGILWRVKQ